jgi:hypothetical protein
VVAEERHKPECQVEDGVKVLRTEQGLRR